MPTNRITEPPPVRDALSPGDTILGHEPRFYHDGSLTAFGRPRPGPAAQAAPASAVPREAPLPYLHVAQQVKGTELRKLESARHRLEQEFAGSAIGMGGQPLNDPGRLAMRRDQARGLELLADQIERLRELEGEALRQWAYDQGYR